MTFLYLFHFVNLHPCLYRRTWSQCWGQNFMGDFIYNRSLNCCKLCIEMCMLPSAEALQAFRRSGFYFGHWLLLHSFSVITDSWDSAILLILDLSAAFDTVDHGIIFSQLDPFVKIKGTALEWFKPYLNKRGFAIRLEQIHLPQKACSHVESPRGPFLAHCSILQMTHRFTCHWNVNWWVLWRLFGLFGGC